MNRETETKVKASLIEVLDAWWVGLDVPTGQIPYAGDDIIEIMAEAALQPLRAVADAQQYLAKNDMLVKEES